MQHSKFSDLKGLAGAIVKMSQDGPGIEQGAQGVTVYYIVDSLELMEKRVNELGGCVIQAKTTESAYGFAYEVSAIRRGTSLVVMRCAVNVDA
ncbi:VOC family protein [Aspergillus novofumigatus IBT 16806]|uniref:Uncharacterized protein n=1 Tax=Aspergillus novofumigatus (strain IBT 16806) TaxID=1392255 RepID=A0A2I1BYL2_ASPN1|nr:uncharacterized protein P174DRAFT_297827 [Aspergillus novofumigatus IBT 16806]PKX90467.1 hypothetical protein P174DRAFT_297827 [Aspergillus novofumigatus IBT 16806]